MTNEETGLKRSTLTDASGRYFISGLPPGYYTIAATPPAGYESGPDSSVYHLVINIIELKRIKPPPITLQKIGAALSVSAPRPAHPASPPRTIDGPPPITSNVEQLVNTTNASRGESFDRRQLLYLPLPGVRTFDDLALLAPGVSPPPQAIGSATGPGVGPGVGTSGQFSVNGLRSRSNNFTIDGSDNNDEEIGVRRQGFTSLVPQSIESVQEFQIITLLPEPQFGRNMGAQVNAVSRSGGSVYHGMIYGFLTDKRLKARDAFDLSGGPANYPLKSNGQQVLLNSQPLAPANPVGGENPFTRAQYGFVFGGPIVKGKTFFFSSFEHQDINASKESHFAVPTVAERGLFRSGDSGIHLGDSTLVPAFLTGSAFHSLFPFPNNPLGPYGKNTFTEILPANADGTIFSVKLDRNITSFGKDHILTGRYNFTDDDTILPVTGEALFSSLRALVRTQNLALSLDSTISPRAINQLRVSYGRTRLNFEEVRDPHLLPSGLLPHEPFLLNAPLIRNVTLPGGLPSFITMGLDTETALGRQEIPIHGDVHRCPGPGCHPHFSPTGTGLLGQVVVSGYSPIGVDVFNFPQGRANNTFQCADTFIYDLRTQVNHRFILGTDVRRNQLNSFLQRNFRPLALFNGTPDVSAANLSKASKDAPGYFLGRDFLSAGAPTGFFQTLILDPSKASPLSTFGLRYWQYNLFLSDQIRLRPNLMLTVGMRYELNTVPTEVNRRIEATFTSQAIKDFIAAERMFRFLDSEGNPKGEPLGKSGLELFLDGRKEIYRQDNNNIAPHVSFAWDPFGDGKTSIRAGYGIYYDQIPGAVIDQSRNVFPTYFTVNLAHHNFGVPNSGFIIPGTEHMFLALSPGVLAVPGTLNTFNLQDPASTPGRPRSLIDPIRFAVEQAQLTQGQSGPGFILPASNLETPYAQHWALSVEREVGQDFLLSLAYVGTRGTHLIRFATPNLGPNAIPVVNSLYAAEFKQIGIAESFPVLFGTHLSLAGEIPLNRPFPLLGSFTSIESDANSIYNSLQFHASKRFSRGIQFTTAYTWSHAIDEVSDMFDLAGARALPQNSFDRRAERGDANFDVRHRFVYSFVFELPRYKSNGLLGGWQLASIGTFQTGQPYSVLHFADVNLDGNLTDRVSAPDLSDAGRAGRNQFRAPGIATVDVMLNKLFRFGDWKKMEVRTEVFNIFNRTHLGIPVHQLFFGGFRLEPLTQKNHFDTRIPGRTIQFGLKFTF
jgi:hypothetical protein